MKFLRRLFRRQPQTMPSPSTEALITGMCMRINNRDPKATANCVRVHMALAVRK
jgi:hypothetical protein